MEKDGQPKLKLNLSLMKESWQSNRQDRDDAAPCAADYNFDGNESLSASASSSQLSNPPQRLLGHNKNCTDFTTAL